MKKFYVMALCLGIVLTGCFGDDTEEVTTDENDAKQEENGSRDREQVIEDSGLEIGSGSGKRNDPYVIDIDEMQTGNVDDYVEGTPRVHYTVPAAAGKTYTATLVVTSTSVDPDARFTLEVSLTGTEGMYTDSDATSLEGLELVGQDMVVSVTTSDMASNVNFNIGTNALGEDVYYEFYVEEE